MRVKVLVIFFAVLTSPIFSQNQNCNHEESQIKWIRNEYKKTRDNLSNYKVYEYFRCTNKDKEAIIVPKDSVSLNVKYLSGEEPYDTEYYTYKSDTIFRDNAYVFVYLNENNRVKYIEIKGILSEGTVESRTEYYVHNNQLFFAYKHEHSEDYWTNPNDYSEQIVQHRFYYCNTKAIRSLEKKLEQSIATGKQTINDMPNNRIDNYSGRSEYFNFERIFGKLLLFQIRNNNE